MLMVKVFISINLFISFTLTELKLYPSRTTLSSKYVYRFIVDGSFEILFYTVRALDTSLSLVVPFMGVHVTLSTAQNVRSP